MNNLVAQKIAEIAHDLSMTATRASAQGEADSDEVLAMRVYVESLQLIAGRIERRFCKHSRQTTPEDRYGQWQCLDCDAKGILPSSGDVFYGDVFHE